MKLVNSFFYSSIFYVLMLFCVGIAHAQSPGNDLIEIQAEYYPKEVYHLGYVANPDQSIRNMYYENDLGKRTYYSFEQLKNPSKPVVLITTKDDDKVYNLVTLRVVPGKSKGVYEVTMGYMSNGVTEKMKTVSYELHYNTRTNDYDVLDVTTGEYISRAYVYTNFWNIPFKGKTAVGIAGIKTFR